MIKIIILPEVFLDAIKKGAGASFDLLTKCKEAKEFKAWTLATTIYTLSEKGNNKEQIRKALEGVSKIPVNDYLCQQALDSEFGYGKGLQLAAAKTFKVSTVVGLKNGGSVRGVDFLSVDEFLEQKPALESQNINFMDLSLAVHPIFDQVDGWFMEIIQNTAFAGGNHVGDFEKEFAAFSKTKHAVGVASGTDALRFALIALGVQEGDEVITVPNTFIATTEAISQAGGIPVFVDVMPDTYNMNPAGVEAKITEKTKVILPVHLYGQMADMEQIMKIAQKHNLKVLEDSCQAHGAELNGKRAGSIGDAAAFSLYPGKNLGAYGEAGCLTTNNLGIARIVSQLRDHGQSEKYYHGMEGYNGRMDNLQAAACRAKIPFMDQWNQERRRVANIYSRNLQNNPNIQIPSVPEGNTPVFHLYVVLVDKPQELQQFLKKRGIFSAFHYPVPLHLQSAYKNRNEEPGSYPVTENCAEKLLSLPMYPELTEEQIIHVCEAIEKFYD